MRMMIEAFFTHSNEISSKRKIGADILDRLATAKLEELAFLHSKTPSELLGVFGDYECQEMAVQIFYACRKTLQKQSLPAWTQFMSKFLGKLNSQNFAKNTREYLQSFNAKIGQVHSFMLDQVVLEGETYNSAYDQLIYADFNMSSITFTAGSSDPQGPTLIEVFYTSILDWLVVMQEDQKASLSLDILRFKDKSHQQIVFYLKQQSDAQAIKSVMSERVPKNKVSTAINIELQPGTSEDSSKSAPQQADIEPIDATIAESTEPSCSAKDKITLASPKKPPEWNKPTSIARLRTERTKKLKKKRSTLLTQSMPPAYNDNELQPLLGRLLKGFDGCPFNESKLKKQCQKIRDLGTIALFKKFPVKINLTSLMDKESKGRLARIRESLSSLSAN